MFIKTIDLLEGLVMELTAFIVDFEEGRDSYVRQKYFTLSLVVAFIGLLSLVILVLIYWVNRD